MAETASDPLAEDRAPRRLDSRAEVAPAVEVSRNPNPLQRIRNVWRYRELLGNLVRKELKVKYKNSILGFVWTLLNPALYLVVFSLVFTEVLRINVPYYAIYFLSGLLVWNFFSTALSGGTLSITSNAQLVQKVWFPREILPLAALGAAIIHFFLQATVLIAALALFRRAPSLDYAPALPLAFLVLVIMAAAMAIALAAVNVYLRDTQHLLELALLAWFWLSAIVYPYRLVAERVGPAREWLISLNPVIPIVLTFQKVLYNPPDTAFGWYTNPRVGGAPTVFDPDGTIPDQAQPALISHPLEWYVTRLSIVAVVAVALLFGALWLFGRLEDDMAEEI